MIFLYFEYFKDQNVGSTCAVKLISRHFFCQTQQALALMFHELNNFDHQLSLLTLMVIIDKFICPLLELVVNWSLLYLAVKYFTMVQCNVAHCCCSCYCRDCCCCCCCCCGSCWFLFSQLGSCFYYFLQLNKLNTHTHNKQRAIAIVTPHSHARSALPLPQPFTLPLVCPCATTTVAPPQQSAKAQPHGHADTYSSAGSLLATPIAVVVVVAVATAAATVAVAAVKQDLLVVRGCLPLMQIARATKKQREVGATKKNMGRKVAPALYSMLYIYIHIYVIYIHMYI